MNKNVITNAKNSYFELMKSKEELTEIKSQLLNLQQTEEIKNCLEVIEREVAKIPSEEEILKYSFYNAEVEDSLCNIYVFIGAYRRNNGKNGVTLVSNYNQADYFIYQNLEKMFSGVVIYPSEQNQFEKDNIIIRFKDSKNIREKFYKLQSVYFREYLNDENISSQKVLEKIRENI